MAIAVEPSRALAATKVKKTAKTAKAAKAGVASTVATAGSVAKAAPVNTKVKLGFIALTDAAPLIMAKELGFFARRGLDVTLEKQSSWPALRDNVLNNQLDGAHALFGMPFSVASGIGGSGATSLKIAMMLNVNGQAITLGKSMRQADSLNSDDKREAEASTFRAEIQHAAAAF